MSVRAGPRPCAYDPDRDEEMREVAPSLFLALDGAADRPDEFVIHVDDAAEQTLRSVSR